MNPLPLPTPGALTPGGSITEQALIIIGVGLLVTVVFAGLGYLFWTYMRLRHGPLRDSEETVHGGDESTPPRTKVI
jgi:hypothetical protein